MDNRVSLPWRVWGLQIAATAILTACGGGGGGSTGDSIAMLSGTQASQPAAPASSCTFSQTSILVDAVRIRQAGAKDISLTLTEPRAIDLLDPGAGVLESLQVAPLTHDAIDVRLHTTGDSTVGLADGTVAPLRVPGNLRLVGDFHLAAGMVADLVVLGFDRCNAIHAAGQSGQFVLNGDVPAMVRALPFVTDREQSVSGLLRPVPGGVYAAVNNPDPGSFTIQRFDAYGNSLGTTDISLGSTVMSPSVTPLANGVVLATWLGPPIDPQVPLAQHFPLMVQRFAADGTPQGAPVQVALTQPFISRGEVPPMLPQAAALADGGAALVWVQLEDGGFVRVYLERFAADGSVVNGPQQVNISGGAGLPNVVGLAGNRVLVAWGVGELFARVFEPDGSAGPEQVLDPAALSLGAPPQLAALTNGGAVVAWTKLISGRFNLVTALRLAPDGAPIGSPLLTFDGAMPAVAGLADGGFVIAWPPGDGRLVAQRFDADGSPLGPVNQINVDTSRANQTSVVALPWGGFLVGWSGTTSDGNVEDVLRFFDAQGLIASGS